MTGPRGDLSALVAELARAPERDLAEAWERSLRPGEVVGRFEILRELGRGGFGVVFEARDLELGRRVAFKAIRPGLRARDPGRESLLRREAEAIARLQHPGLVTLFDLGQCDRGPYLVLELLEGETLAERLRSGPLALREAVRIALEVARALAHAHAHGVLHRDLKPSNVFLATGGAVKVLDFGLAHVFGAGGPAGSGTPGYMAPEQVAGGAEDERTDVHALGVLLHELLAPRGEGAPTAPDLAARPDAARPLLDAPRVPAALAALAARMVAPDPAARPASAGAVVRELERIAAALAPRRPGLRRKVALAVVLAAALAAAGGWLAGWLSGGGRIAVAVADVRNDTGDPAVDGLSGLLATALEPSLRIAVLPRARLLDLAGRDAVRLTAEAARAAADRARADVVLALAVSSDAGGYALRLRALSPAGGDERDRFALEERSADRAGLPAAVGRLAGRARDALEAREPGASDPAAGAARPPDLEAYRHHFQGEACAARPVYGHDCAAHFRRAVARDPEFAAAHYQLAVWNAFNGDAAEQRRALASALRHAARAPEKERLWIEAWAAYLDGRVDEAVAAYARAAERFPDDPHAPYQAGDILRHEDRYREALPWFERSAAQDPSHGWALAHLVEALGATGRLDALREHAAAWAEGPPTPAALHALSLARGWLGDAAGAAETARQALALGGGATAQQDLLAARIFAGAHDEVERELRLLAGPGSEVRPIGFYALAAVAAYQGRFEAGRRELDALRAALPGLRSEASDLGLRVDYLAGAGDVSALREDLAALRGLDPRAAAGHAPVVAWLGDAALAAELARPLPAGAPLARAHAAVAAFRRGEREEALSALRALSEETPFSVWRIAPVFLYGVLAAEAGRDEAAVDALRRFEALYLPRMLWRSWALPLALLRRAQAEERLGRSGDARATVERLLGAWRGAEEGDAVLLEARALRARLAARR